MKIYSVFDPEFHAYGQIVDGMEDTIAALLEALAKTPQGEAVAYVPEEPLLQNLPEMQEIADHCYGGMPVQLGWCNGHNTKLNCLEYHRDSAAGQAVRYCGRGAGYRKGQGILGSCRYFG